MVMMVYSLLVLCDVVSVILLNNAPLYRGLGINSQGWISPRVKIALSLYLGRVTRPHLGLAVRFKYLIGLVLNL